MSHRKANLSLALAMMALGGTTALTADRATPERKLRIGTPEGKEKLSKAAAKRERKAAKRRGK